MNKALVKEAEKYISMKQNLTKYDLVAFAEKQIFELEQKLEQTEKDLADYQFNYPTIKELEKENAELRYQLNKNPCVKTPEWHCSDCLKENAELKDDNKVMADNYSKMEQKFYNQLTNAKEHIKQLLDCLKQDTNDPQTNYYVCKYMDKAEQFLKDSEVEK